MALTVKLAMLISFGAVGAITWVVNTVDPPQIRRPLPLVVTDIRGRFADGRPAPGLVLGTQVDRRSELTRQLQHPSPLEVQLTENWASGPALALMPPALPPTDDGVQPTLPPLAYADGPNVAGSYDAAAPVSADAPPVNDGGEVLIAGAAEALVGSPVSTDSEWKRVRAAKSDTLLKIAARECGQRDARVVALLADANPQLKARGNRLRTGEELVVPTPAAVQRWLAGDQAAGPVVAAADGTEKKSVTTDADRWYTIRRNDSLERIAQQQLKDSGRWREILSLNRTLNPSRIQPGMRIKLPPALKIAQR